MMTVLPYGIAYLGIVVFIIAVIARFLMWSRMPMHLRWELYPVAHEGGGRAAYGGSYLELPEWWTKKREVSLLGEIKVMVPEILLLVALREHNKKLWTRSFPFHFGLYLVAACTALMILNALVLIASPGLAAGAVVVPVLDWLIPVTGYAGLVLGLVGAIGLLQRRAGTKSLRMYSAPADFFNLVIFVVAFGVALLTAIVVDPAFTGVSGFVAGLVTFDPAPVPAAVAVSAILLGLLLAYIPLTHMSHFVGKYFAYHAIRWQDEPNLPGGHEEAKIQELLGRPVTWAAPHIRGDGKRTWADVATEEMEK